MLHIIYNEKTGSLTLKQCDGCEENKDDIKNAIDSTIKSMQKSYELRESMAELRKGLKGVSYNLGKGKSMDEAVKNANEIFH